MIDHEVGEKALVEADGLLEKGDRAAAASALDRAYGNLPADAAIAQQRLALLDEFALHEHGLVWRYVPAGPFMMGSNEGDPDERPVHSRMVDAFWITDVPITWAAYCRLMGWEPPPIGFPPEDQRPEPVGNDNPLFILRELGKMRRQYCESDTNAARDWHRHYEDEQKRALAWDVKPLIAASAGEAEDLAARLTELTPGVAYGLPTEAEWEKAARGGLIGARYSWGNEPPTKARCDFDHFGGFHIGDPRAFPANGYGLHGMCGGVSEWTRDRYDALAYRIHAGASAPAAAARDDDAPRVLRGGSWSDCADAVTVSFRTSRTQRNWREPDGRDLWGTPNVGFRLVRR